MAEPRTVTGVLSTPHLIDEPIRDITIPYRSSLLKKNMPGLDAIRGLAVFSVLLYHGLFWDTLQTPPPNSIAEKISEVMKFGWLGVFLFFVLSGFLITGILLDTKRKPHYWRNFYIRRLLRLFPAFVLTLALLKIFAHASWLYIVVCLSNMANLAPMMHIPGTSYGPLWSLAVEEQFYIGWPLLVKRLRRRDFACVVVGTIVLSPALRYLSASKMLPLGDAHSMTWLISDNLGLGALIALFLRSKWARVDVVRKLAVAALIAGIMMLAAGIPLGILHRANLMGSAMQTVPFELIFGSLLLFSLLFGDRPKVYSWTTPLRFLGYISYGLYLYHLLVFRGMDWFLKRLGLGQNWSVSEWVGRFALESGVAIFIAYLSRRFFEEFFLRMKFKLTGPRGI
jgi:peptidoglycan/LPS O-acetylase OafA/YrhL